VQPAIMALWLVAAAPASPTSRAPLRLEMERCGDLDEAVVKRVVSMEFGASLVEVAGVVTTAHVECRGAEVGVTVDDPVTGKTSTRVLDLAGQPRDLRSRLLGLAISEAVLASWIELAIAPEPALPPDAPTVPPEARREVADIAARHVSPAARASFIERYKLAVGPAVRWFGSGLVVKGLAVDAFCFLRSNERQRPPRFAGRDHRQRPRHGWRDYQRKLWPQCQQWPKCLRRRRQVSHDQRHHMWCDRSQCPVA
jgi:hypothetical protein